MVEYHLNLGPPCVLANNQQIRGSSQNSPTYKPAGFRNVVKMKPKGWHSDFQEHNSSPVLPNLYEPYFRGSSNGSRRKNPPNDHPTAGVQQHICKAEQNHQSCSKRGPGVRGAPNSLFDDSVDALSMGSPRCRYFAVCHSKSDGLVVGNN